jgi:hypothetical protein
MRYLLELFHKNLIYKFWEYSMVVLIGATLKMIIEIVRLILEYYSRIKILKINVKVPKNEVYNTKNSQYF